MPPYPYPFSAKDVSMFGLAVACNQPKGDHVPACHNSLGV